MKRRRVRRSHDLLQFARDVAGCMTAAEEARFVGSYSKADVELMIAKARELVRANLPLGSPDPHWNQAYPERKP